MRLRISAENLLLITHRRNAVAAGERAGQVRLVGQPGGESDVGGGHAVGEKRFSAPQANRHQHLVRRNVEVRFELALEMVRAQRRYLRQLIEGHRTHIVIVQIVAHPLEAVAGFGQRSGVMGKRAEGIDQIQQQTPAAPADRQYATGRR